MTTLDDYENSKTRLNELSAAHIAAIAEVDAIKLKLDLATSKANRLREQLEEENAKYVELERRVEEEKAQ